MKEHLTHVGAVLILFTTEDTEDAEVNLGSHVVWLVERFTQKIT